MFRHPICLSPTLSVSHQFPNLYLHGYALPWVTSNLYKRHEIQPVSLSSIPTTSVVKSSYKFSCQNLTRKSRERSNWAHGEENCGMDKDSIDTHIHDLPDVLLSNIFSLVSDTRSRNAMSLVCLRWHLLERLTRTSLTLRGNIRDLLFVPTCFRSVTDLDLSLLSPWGHPLLDFSPDPILLAHLLHNAFPSVVSLTIYIRSPATLYLLAPRWPNLFHVKLVRWHQRSPTPLGSDFHPLFENCLSLSSLDLSHFYCWTEDLQPALETHPATAASLSRLDILTYTSSAGFRSSELLAITAACPNLHQLLAACVFDHRYVDFVGDSTLLALASNCPQLSLLHLADISVLSNARTNLEDDGFTAEDAGISHAMLLDLFIGLPKLEELALDINQNVRDAGPALELLHSKCPRLKSLTLGRFHGICRAVDSKLDGVSLCRGLESLSIRNCADLTDYSLTAISLGCTRLAKFEIQGCKRITEIGIRTMAHALQQTLVDVKISCCKHLNAVRSLRALEPIQDKIQRLHIDCEWRNRSQQSERSSSHTPSKLMNCPTGKRFANWEEEVSCSKKSKYYSQMDSANISYGSLFPCKSWAQLQHLSLWIAVGELLTPLILAGLDNCPALEEIQIRVEGDCRQQPKPSELAFGLSCLSSYPRLSKMHLDCGGVIGYALTAPSGHMDLSLWERFYLNKIGNLNLLELNYWPPQDTDVNHRSLSLPAAGLLAECSTLRKLFIHGTANEHLMMFLLKIPNLRDVQLREDYYPAPENDTSTEMRVDSCCRFEDALNSRQIPD
ncbi:COI1, F-box [Dillenia turbinata]|uniref:COI1, F-box n=1 Tax=Dillenia turbinata TaxID=194707 RepID=A0AAN8VJA8_9MAGN